MAWQVMVVVPPEQVDEVSGALWASGTLGIEQLTTTLDDDRSVEELRAGFAHRVVAEEALAVVEAAYPAWMVEVADDAGLDDWRAFAKVQRAGPFVIRPTWIDPERTGDEIEILIDPRRTFGSGSHASTRLALCMLSEVVVPGDRVLDVGVGSGVLSVGAAKLGAREAIGVDIDPDSVEVVADNAAVNGVDGQVSALCVPVAALDGVADLVIANIIAPVLHELSADLMSRVRPGGYLVLAGFLEEQEQAIRDRFGPMTVTHRLAEEGWVCLAMRREVQ